MPTNGHDRCEDATGQGKPYGRGKADRDFEARNSIDKSSISNAIQASHISGGVHIYGTGPASAYTPNGSMAAGHDYDTEVSHESDAQKRSAVAEYFTRIAKKRSPIILWFLFAMAADMSIVSLFEYFLGAQLPGEPPSVDLESAQVGLFFAVVFASIILWRHIARRNGSGKWPELSEVHPWIVKFLRKRLAATLVTVGLILLAASLVPNLMDPIALTTYTPTTTTPTSGPGGSNASGMSDFGYTFNFFVMSLEAAAFCIYVSVKYGSKEVPGID